MTNEERTEHDVHGRGLGGMTAVQECWVRIYAAAASDLRAGYVNESSQADLVSERACRIADRAAAQFIERFPDATGVEEFKRCKVDRRSSERFANL